MAKEEVLVDLKVDTSESEQSINSLRAAVKELTKARNAANLETDEGRASVVRLNAEIDKNNKVIKENVDAYTKQKIGIGDYKNSIVDASKELNVFGVNVGQATSKIASFTNPATLAIGVLGALGSAYANSTTGAKDLEFASNQLGAATGILSEKFAKLFSSAEDGQGFFSTVLSGILFQISPEIATQSNLIAISSEKIQDLEREEIVLRTTINDRLQENQEKLTAIQSEQTSIAEKAQLTKDIQDNLRANSKDQINLKKQELDQLTLQLNLDQDNEAKQQAVLEKKREISDIEKDTTKAIERTQKLQDNIVQGQLKRVDNEQLINEKLIIQNDILLAQDQIKKQQAENNLLSAVDLNALNEETQALNLESLQKYLDDEQELYNKEFENYKSKEQKKSQLDILTNQNKLSNASLAFGQIKSLIDKESAAYKILAIVQASIDTYRGAAAALAPPPIGAGPLFGPILAATTIGLGLANVAKIAGFAEGGVIREGFGVPINRSNGDNILATVKTGEVILNQQQQAALGGSNTFRAIGVPGFAEGGIVGFPTSSITPNTGQQFDLNRLSDLIASQKIFVAVEDINSGQGRVASVVERASF